MKRLAPILLLLTFFAFLTGLSYADPRVTTGAVSAANSVIGQYDNEHIGSAGVYELPSGNLVIVSPDWGDETGAVTCLTPAEYQAGNTLIEGDNSLRGSSESDFVGSGGIAILSNGNYVVRSPMWGAGIGALTLNFRQYAKTQIKDKSSWVTISATKVWHTQGIRHGMGWGSESHPMSRPTR